MPYVSQSQERFFHSPGAAKAGISKSMVNEWDKATKGHKLPEKVWKKKNVVNKEHIMIGI